VNPAIGGKPPAALPEIGRPGIELPPADCHLVAVGRVNRYRGFVCCVADDVVSIGIDVRLVADEPAIGRDRSRRCLQPVNVRRRHIVFFHVVLRVQPRCRCFP